MRTSVYTVVCTSIWWSCDRLKTFVQANISSWIICKLKLQLRKLHLTQLFIYPAGQGGHAYLKEWLWWAGLISSKWIMLALPKSVNCLIYIILSELVVALLQKCMVLFQGEKGPSLFTLWWHCCTCRAPAWSNSCKNVFFICGLGESAAPF